jgi:hypothetical protein
LGLLLQSEQEHSINGLFF